MRTTVTIDDDLIERAKKLTNVKETASVIRLAVEHMVAFESARGLVSLAGSEPNLKLTPRRRLEGES